MAGFEILKDLRAEVPDLRVVVVSGCMQGVLLSSARMFGAAATLEKPVDPEVLLRTIREILGGEVADYASGVVIFNVGGNKYRVIASVDFAGQIVVIDRVMTHERYDRDTI